mmetsp:Transcript_4887/g.18336  ORF Transcript_4887/g.18336 Transcript_4887/m.18336 type:complete len:144 (-) Transcript_4887:209-640(-)
MFSSTNSTNTVPDSFPEIVNTPLETSQQPQTAEQTLKKELAAQIEQMEEIISSGQTSSAMLTDSLLESNYSSVATEAVEVSQPEEEESNVAQTVEDLQHTRFAAQIQLIKQEMGFGEIPDNKIVELLEKYKGNLSAVVNALIQ